MALLSCGCLLARLGEEEPSSGRRAARLRGSNRTDGGKRGWTDGQICRGDACSTSSRFATGEYLRGNHEYLKGEQVLPTRNAPLFSLPWKNNTRAGFAIGVRSHVQNIFRCWRRHSRRPKLEACATLCLLSSPSSKPSKRRKRSKRARIPPVTARGGDLRNHQPLMGVKNLLPRAATKGIMAPMRQGNHLVADAFQQKRLKQARVPAKASERTNRIALL